MVPLPKCLPQNLPVSQNMTSVESWIPDLNYGDQVQKITNGDITTPVSWPTTDSVPPINQFSSGVLRTPSPVTTARAQTTTPHPKPLGIPGIKELDKAAAFMSTKPGGAEQTGQRDMQITERRVSSQLQKKSTTSATGKVALVSVATASAARNRPTIPVCTPDNHKRKVASTATQKQHKKKNSAKKTSTSIPAVTPAKQQRTKLSAAKMTDKTLMVPVDTTPKCKFGCSHGGLIELLQMTPKDIRHYLEQGKYLHGKDCLDCNTNISELFAATKSKANFLLYYCQVDYNGAELEDDSHELKAIPCACVLCVPCYFEREKHKNETTGANGRSSGRGRATRQRS